MIVSFYFSSKTGFFFLSVVRFFLSFRVSCLPAFFCFLQCGPDVVRWNRSFSSHSVEDRPGAGTFPVFCRFSPSAVPGQRTPRMTVCAPDLPGKHRSTPGGRSDLLPECCKISNFSIFSERIKSCYHPNILPLILSIPGPVFRAVPPLFFLFHPPLLSKIDYTNR